MAAGSQVRFGRDICVTQVKKLPPILSRQRDLHRHQTEGLSDISRRVGGVALLDAFTMLRDRRPDSLANIQHMPGRHHVMLQGKKGSVAFKCFGHSKRIGPGFGEEGLHHLHHIQTRCGKARIILAQKDQLAAIISVQVVDAGVFHILHVNDAFRPEVRGAPVA